MAKNIRKIDDKGRIMLSAKTKARTYLKGKALKQVRRGLAEAKQGELVRLNNLHEDGTSWIEKLSDY